MEARETRNMISTMPKEILLEVASYLPTTRLSRFTRTDCNSHTELIDELHTRAVKANKGTVALAHAAQYNHVSLAKSLLDHRVSMIAKRRREDNSAELCIRPDLPIARAAVFGSLEVFKVLLEHGAGGYRKEYKIYYRRQHFHSVFLDIPGLAIEFKNTSILDCILPQPSQLRLSLTDIREAFLLVCGKDLGNECRRTILSYAMLKDEWFNFIVRRDKREVGM